MSQEIRPGYYLDHEGNWQRDRRSGHDRRTGQNDAAFRDRRLSLRRQADREFLERETKAEIQDALEDFAKEHGGHL